MINSPVKYFGGKGGGFGVKIIEYFPDKDLYDNYIEAFAGSANVLLNKEPSGVEIYNDLEHNVYSLFKVLASKEMFPEFKRLCDLGAVYSRELREECKQDLKKSDLTPVERAYKFFYLNRTSVNGVGGISIATCIRRNMSKSVSDLLSSIDGLMEIHDRLSRVIIENTDGIGLIQKWDRPRTFMYLDPPYHQDTRTEARYKCDMSNEQQKAFIDTVLGLKHAKILISGYNCPEYARLEKHGMEKIEIKVKTQDGNRKPKNKVEVLWRNYGKNDGGLFV